MSRYLRVAGPLDVAAVSSLERAVTAGAGVGDRVVVDLSRVTHVDARAAARLTSLSMLTRRAGSRLLVVPPDAVDASSWLVAVWSPGVWPPRRAGRDLREEEERAWTLRRTTTAPSSRSEPSRSGRPGSRSRD